MASDIIHTPRPELETATAVDVQIVQIEARYAALGRATEWVTANVPHTFVNARGYVDDKSPKYDPDAHLARILRVAEWLLDLRDKEHR